MMQQTNDCGRGRLGAGNDAEKFILLARQARSAFFQIARGKSKAARRPLPMVPEVYQALKARYEAQGRPAEGWVFPTGAASGHMEESSAKQWHAKALETLEKARKENSELPEIKPFEPYCLRHTFGTRMAPKCDVFGLARIMGHSSITITQRYVHTQSEAIEQAFQKLVTEGGHPHESSTEESPIEIEVTVGKSKG
jgi:integrase